MTINFCPECGTTLAGPRKFCKVCRLSFSGDKNLGMSVPVVVNNQIENRPNMESDNGALPLFLVGLGLFFLSILLVTPIFLGGVMIMIFMSLIFMGVMFYYQFHKGGSW